MNDEAVFLRTIVASPEDRTHHLVYADWLEERGDPRADFLRLDNGFERIHYFDWLEKDCSPEWYIERFPEVRQLAEDRRATAKVRSQLRELSVKLDPNWVAFMNTLACPFQPFFFFNNHGNPRECQTEELPFAEKLGTRGSVVTFESALRSPECWDPGLMGDLRFLCELELGECYFGAATCPVHPFICDLDSERRPPIGADVIAALRARDFLSEHIQTLEATTIAFPGYHPDTENDEIHNDFLEQHIFQSQKDEDEEEAQAIDEFSGTHGLLKRFVADEQLWYVLLHMTPEQVEEFQFSRYVVLFAVGRSPNGSRLVGVITHQVCHNLCD